MTPQEHTLLEDFLGRLQAAGAVSRDPQADALIRSRLDGHPEATYLLVQRCLLLDRALADANQQIATLRQQVSQAGAGNGNSFLNAGLSPQQQQVPDGFGRAPSQAYSPEPRYEPSGPQGGPAYAQAQPQGWRERWFGGGGASNAGAQAQAPGGMQAAPAAAAAGGGGSSFLGRAATTAAGVAGGMFLFNGIEHLMGGGNSAAAAGAGHTGNSLLGDANDSGSLGTTMTENITENNFIDEDRSGSSQQGFLDDGGNGGDSWASNDDGGFGDDGDGFA